MTSALTANKVGALFVFLSTSFIGVWVPYFIPVRQEILKFGLLLSSGLFLSLAFLHLSGDCVSLFREKYSGSYPLPFLIIVGGFYLTWFADLVATSIWKKRNYKANVVAFASAEEVADGPISCCQLDEEQVLDAVSRPPPRCRAADCACSSAAHCVCRQRFDAEGSAETLGPTLVGAMGLGSSSDGLPSSEDRRAGSPPKPPPLSLLDVILLLVALMFHAIFEGLAVGLAATPYNVWNLTLSICLNEFFEGAALGTTLRAQDTKRPPMNFFWYALTASVVCPIGVVIGIVLDTTTTPAASSWAQGIGNGIAAGVFICIASRHLIAKAMLPDGPEESLWMPFLKFSVSCLGLTINALTTLKGE